MRYSMAVLSALLSTACIAETANSQESLLRAVSFALTGSDGRAVETVDRARCIFTVGGRTVHFSNIDTSRLVFTPWQYPYGAVIEVQVHGPSTVVETYSQAHPTGTELDSYLLARDPWAFEPKNNENADYVFEVETTEGERLRRAWRYIYAHGCKSFKSPF